MHSLVYAALGLLGVVLSLPVALFIYRVVLGIQVFGTLNFLGLFVLLGIGADDLFLFRDAYVQVGVALDRAVAAGVRLSADDLKYGRLEAAYSRSVTAMAITTATTALSFAGNIVSIIPPVREFGIFTSMLVCVNYIIVCTWFPAIVVGTEWAKKTHCGRKEATKPETSSAQGDDVGDVELAGVGDSTKPSESDGSAPAVEHVEENASARFLEQYFGGPHAKTVHMLRYPILGFFFVFIVLCTIAATQIETSEEPAQFLPPDHPFWRSVLLRGDFDLPSRAVNDGSGGNVLPTSVQFEVLFGISGIDKESKDPADPSDLGAVVWNADWDITKPAIQQHILDMCDALESGLPDTIVSGVSGCFMRPFSAWLVAERGLTFPLDADNTGNAAALVLEWFNEQGPPFANPYGQQLGFLLSDDGLVVKFVKLIVDTPIKPFTPASRLEPLYDEINEFLDTQNAAAPAGGEVILSSFWFMIMRTESVLVDTAILCASVSVCLAFLLLLAASRNIIITLASTFCILVIVAVVLAFMWAAGWTLGIIESINLTVLVGLSVDYVVHLAVAYGLHARGKRFARMQVALEHMGISVFSAAVTTIGSAICLTFTVVLFFVRFGVFIIVTLGSSLVVAFVLFPALMYVFGPENDEKKPTSDDGDAIDQVVEASFAHEEASTTSGAAKEAQGAPLALESVDDDDVAESEKPADEAKDEKDGDDEERSGEEEAGGSADVDVVDPAGKEGDAESGAGPTPVVMEDAEAAVDEEAPGTPSDSAAADANV